MGRQAVVAILVSLVVTMAWADTIEDEPNQVNWAKRLVHGGNKDTLTTFQFYFHDAVSGKNPSAVRVAQASGTTNSPTFFGALLMADDPLTEGPEPSSKLVGRAQGLYGFAGQKELGLIMAMNFGFIDGKFNGSFIRILGLNSALHPVREMAVVGGTGVFRLR